MCQQSSVQFKCNRCDNALNTNTHLRTHMETFAGSSKQIVCHHLEKQIWLNWESAVSTPKNRVQFKWDHWEILILPRITWKLTQNNSRYLRNSLIQMVCHQQRNMVNTHSTKNQVCQQIWQNTVYRQRELTREETFEQGISSYQSAQSSIRYRESNTRSNGAWIPSATLLNAQFWPRWSYKPQFWPGLAPQPDTDGGGNKQLWPLDYLSSSIVLPGTAYLALDVLPLGLFQHLA